jgi:hypothetical protein
MPRFDDAAAAADDVDDIVIGDTSKTIFAHSTSPYAYISTHEQPSRIGKEICNLYNFSKPAATAVSSAIRAGSFLIHTYKFLIVCHSLHHT